MEFVHDSPTAQGWDVHAGQRRLEDAVLVARKLAHAYSNALTSILGFVEMSLNQVPAGSTLKRYLDVAFRGAQQAVELTERLRLLGCKATLSSQGAMLLPALAREIGRRATPERKVEETLDVPGDLPPVALSSEQVRALLDVLLANAHEALEHGGRVSIVARVVTPGPDEVRKTWGRMETGRFVQLDVSDTGAGLAPEARERLFHQPFFSTKPRHHGLGLIIAHSIVSSQQGGICLCDNPGGGLTARVYLPVHTADGVPATPGRRTSL
jgi:signal transduction histidine kinase